MQNQSLNNFKKPELLSLKPLSSSKDSKNLKTILPCIDPPPAFKTGEFSSSVQNPNAFTPISLSGFKVPEAPKLSKLTKVKPKEPSGSEGSFKLFERALNPIDLTFGKSYNSLMNQIRSKELGEKSPNSEGEKSPNSEGEEDSESEEESLNPLIKAEIESEESLDPKDLKNLEEPLDPSNSKDYIFISPKNHVLNLRRDSPVSEGIPSEVLGIPKTKQSAESLKLHELLEDSEPLLRPKTEGSEDLDEELIETLKISKKECKVFDSLNKNKLYSYSKIRENTDNLIFCIKEDMNESSLIQKEDLSETLYKFYSYSKLEIYNQYSKCHSQMYFHLKIRKYKIYGASIESNDLEIFWIPMIQIVRLLEYSHPVYEIEKTKFSMNLYNLKPVRLSK